MLPKIQKCFLHSLFVCSYHGGSPCPARYLCDSAMCREAQLHIPFFEALESRFGGLDDAGSSSVQPWKI